MIYFVAKDVRDGSSFEEKINLCEGDLEHVKYYRKDGSMRASILFLAAQEKVIRGEVVDKNLLKHLNWRIRMDDHSPFSSTSI